MTLLILLSASDHVFDVTLGHDIVQVFSTVDSELTLHAIGTRPGGVGHVPILLHSNCVLFYDGA